MVKFADRMDLLKGSAIRELLALANKPEIISFAGGMPAPELFPVERSRPRQTPCLRNPDVSPCSTPAPTAGPV